MKKVFYGAVFFGLMIVFFGNFEPVLALSFDKNASTAAEIDNSAMVLDLTVPKVKVSRMENLLNSQVVKATPINFIKLGIRRAIGEGISINTIILLFLFPLVASLVAFSRQVVGLNGFGMITPALLSMAFLSTGGVVGIFMLFFVVGVAILGKLVTKKIKIPYLPKLAILLWMVSMAVLGLIVSSPYVGLSKFLEIGIFPIILFVSVAETFIEAQITRSFGASLTMMVETVILAIVGYKIMNSPMIQSMVLLNPEAMSLFILILNMLIGRYKGLRLLEVWRFRKIIIR